MKGVRLRRHPYPFRCSLAICSDLDRCSFADFAKLHQFLNTKAETPFGEGLGLEIGDSFWMYSAGSQTDDAFSYFEGVTTRPSKYAEFIRDGIQTGYLDCLHTYGHFSQYGGFRRSLAEFALQELDRYNLKVKVWTNHGDVHNFQNLLGHGLGDLPVDVQSSGDSVPVEEYHADVTLRYGMEFAWTGDNTDLIGQNRRYSLREYTNVRAIMCVRAVIKKMLNRSIRPICDYDNHLILAQQLQDGRKIFTFCRFLPELRWGRDFGDDLKYALSRRVLDKFEKNKGFMVVYVHLGKKRIPEILSPETIECLRDLQCRFDSERIWVTTTSKLLTYNRVSRFLSWNCRTENGDIIITINGLDDPVKEVFLPSPQDCQGLTWYTPVPERTRVLLLNGQELRVATNPKDETGRRSVSVPLVPLDPTEWLSLHHPL